MLKAAVEIEEDPSRHCDCEERGVEGADGQKKAQR